MATPLAVQHVELIVKRGYTAETLVAMAISSAEDGRITYEECAKFIIILRELTEAEESD